MKYIALALLFVLTFAVAQDKTVTVSRVDLLAQLSSRRNLLSEQIRAANDQLIGLDAQIGFLQGLKSDSLTVPEGWVAKKAEEE